MIIADSKTATTRSYVAFEQGSNCFGLPLANVRRVARHGHVNEAGSTQVACVGTGSFPVLDLGWVLGASQLSEDARYWAVLRSNSGDCVVIVDKALGVFNLDPRDIRSAPPWIPRVTAGFAPLLSLGRLLSAGAVRANIIAQSAIASLGPLLVNDGKLTAGSTLLNGTTEIVDRVKATTQYGCTIFAHNVRVSTTATQLGSSRRAIGTRANALVTEVTLDRGREFRGTTRTLGKDWTIVYRPLRKSNQDVVGMVATFREVSHKLFPLLDINQLSSLKRPE